ncbi:MAG: dihydrofolate reductase family protein [Methanospirillum sp.]|uniref:RibD family protein n=1 Tax=Methanospirillum sp. TaxID=45200 RepID=UPI00236B335D|nr:dihydrofolate reductase family protein [Methanospirillum sp.]MDD1727835.1 dihydrofolate reductase family protein [Methanospirillum sp.]
MSGDQNRPHVVLVSEVTVDGKLTVTRGASSKLLMQFMSHEAEVLLHRIRAESDAIMVGSNTIRIDNSFLTVRHVQGKNPIRVIPSSRADISPDANVLSADSPTIIAVSEQADPVKIAVLKEKGAHIEVVGKDKVDLTLLMSRLASSYGVSRLMIEGGSTLNGQMFSLGLIDEIVLIHLPFIAGGSDTPSLVGGLATRSVDDLIRLELTKNYLAGENLITEYKVRRV